MGKYFVKYWLSSHQSESGNDLDWILILTKNVAWCYAPSQYVALSVNSQKFLKVTIYIN